MHRAGPCTDTYIVGKVGINSPAEARLREHTPYSVLSRVEPLQIIINDDAFKEAVIDNLWGCLPLSMHGAGMGSNWIFATLQALKGDSDLEAPGEARSPCCALRKLLAVAVGVRGAWPYGVLTLLGTV